MIQIGPIDSLPQLCIQIPVLSCASFRGKPPFAWLKHFHEMTEGFMSAGDLDHTMAGWLRICIAVCLLHKHVLHPVIINMITMIVLVGASVLICSFCNFRCSLPDTWHWANWCVSVRKMSRFQSQWRQGGKGVQRLPFWSISPVPKEVSYQEMEPMDDAMRRQLK